MTKTKFLFVAIDYLYAWPQNPCSVLCKNKGVEVEKNIVFDESIPAYKLDTYHVPKAEGKYPVIFEIHGGGFTAGDKKYRTALSTWYAKQTGAYVFNVNYGLGREVTFPDPVIHLIKAFNYVVANAEKYNLDLDKMIVTGDSAGGYYSSFLSAYPDSPLMQEACGGIQMNGRFSACVLNCGIYDVETAMKQKVLFNLTKDVCLDFAGITPDQFDTYKWRDAVAPINNLTASFPKTCVVYADQDVFCKGQGPRLLEKLRELGVYTEEFGSKKFLDNHTFSLTWISKASKQANQKIITFMRNFLNGNL